MSVEVARTRRLVLSIVAGLLVVAWLIPAAWAQGAAAAPPYSRMSTPIPVETGKKIEVIEFFSYGCPHCAEFEPYLDDWLKNLPADVSFRRIPVMFQAQWVDLAKVYYTLDALGEEAKLSPEVFTAIHGKGVALWTPAKFYDWAATKGLDRKKVEDMYNSFTMSGKVNRAKQLAQAYNIQEVPTIVIDGKYITSPKQSGGHAATPAVMTGLVAKARAERPKS